MMQDHGHQSSRKTLVASPEVAMANEVFDLFCNATTLKSILGHFRHLCELLNMRPNTFPQFYPKFKSKLRSWKAQALWKKFDQRANHKCYNRGKACSNTRVLIIGGGPCGLRSAIEAQLLGAKVVVVEKRDRMSRNNVLHLWPFVIQDLRALGAKKFFGKFCAGSIDHISIRQLQCILLKVALILGVEFHEGLSFDALIPPPENQEEGKIGWRVKTTPKDHPVSQYEFDVLIGADGKRNTLEGFRRKEFRGKLAIAITANFINKRTEAEARVEEISGVAFIFNQKFFKELYQETGIDLENIVYYKDDTHYFVMTAKKHSLIDKGVILQDHADTAKLLAKENVDRDALMLYAREAAEFSTQYQMMDMEFAVNHYGQPDVAMFDFTSMYAAENASRVLERHNHRLLMTLVGDSLLEPFWPTGSGCARGFLSSMDAGWAIKGWGASLSPLEVLAERESIYRLLGQTTPENLNRDYAAYTLDPHTRYPNLNVRSVSSVQVRGLLDTDDPENMKLPSVLPSTDVPKKRRRRDTQIHPDTLLHWLQRQVALYDTVQITDLTSSFKDGLAICAIIHRYRPDLIDFYSLKSDEIEKNNQLAYDVLEKELGIAPIMSGEEMVRCDIPDKLAMFSYLTQIYEAFRGEIPHIKHPKLEPETDEVPLYDKQLAQLTPGHKVQLIGRLAKIEPRPRYSRSSRHNIENVQAMMEKKPEGSLGRRSRKRRSNEKMGATVEERQKRLEDIVNNRIERMKRRQFLRKMATQQFYKSLQMLQANAKREKEEPFEDYSIFLYRQTAPDFKDRVKELEQKILYPDRDPKMPLNYKGGVDEDFSGRIKSIEDKLRGTAATEKKPRDLLRAIGKIEKTDWNVKEIEKKIEESKMSRGIRQDKVERVPKWSREQFLARQIKMEKKGRDPNEVDAKYAEIDSTLRNIDRKIKEGNVLGHNKVSAMAEQFANKNQDAEPKVQRSNSKAAIALPTQGGSEMCHFCDKRVYLMERLSAEGKFFHRGCFRCEYCSTSLRIGNHTFDRDKNGGRFYCTQHFGLSGTIKTRIEKKKTPALNKENIPDSSGKKKQTLEKTQTLKPPLDGITGLDLLDRGQTPERIEFENLAGMSDAEEARSQMDEDEWTDRNFGASAAELGSSDDISDMSDSDEDNEIYEEAIDQPLTTEGTIELAKNWTLRYSHAHPSAGHSDTGSNEYEDSSDEYTSEDEESGTATEDEEDVRARELRKQEVWLKVPPRESDTETGSETEVASDDDSSEECQENSATEISTDSEFEHDGITPTQHEIPEITINDAFVRKTRGQYVEPKKVQVKSRMISPVNGNIKQKTEEPEASVTLRKVNAPKISDSPRPVSVNPVPLVNPRKGDYLLNRTHSTEGIASKLSLELKKRYLLGGSVLGGSVMKSGSTSNVDTKLRNFTDAISQHQKLLNPAPEPSPTMQAFLQGTNKLRATSSIPLSPISSTEMFRSPLKTNKVPEVDKPKESGDYSKRHLPDLIKESNIMKSKTDPNILRTGFMKQEKKIVKEEGTKVEEQKEKNEKINEITVEMSKDTKIIEPSDVNDICRPRSPLHETSIVVPQVNWKKKAEKNKDEEGESSEDSEMDSDSLSSSDIDANDEIESRDQKLQRNLSPPRLQIHSTDGDLLLDEGADRCKDMDTGITFEPDSIECILNVREDEERLQTTGQSPSKSIDLWSRSSNDKNKSTAFEIETINNNFKRLDLKDNSRVSNSNCSSPTSIASILSNKQDDSMENDITTAALTETELSEWARDGEGLVSTDLRDTEFDVSSKGVSTSKRILRGHARIAKEEDLTDIEPSSEEILNKIDRTVEIPSNDTSKLLVNGEDIDYMDTDNESLLDSLRDATNVPLVKNRGYVEFVNVAGISSSLVKESRLPLTDAPIARAEAEPELCSDDEKYDGNVIEINPVTMEDVKDRLKNSTNKLRAHEHQIDIQNEEIQVMEAVNREVIQSMDEDSLVVIEPAEDTTTSELTTILVSPVCCSMPQIEGESKTSEEPSKLETTDANHPDYLEYVKRLQSRIAEFSNVKDSIDVRKSKRKNSKSTLQDRSAEMIAEEIKCQDSLNASFNSPATSRKLEEITRERSKQKNLIQDLLMDKIEAHKQKSAEKKAKRAARTASFNVSGQLFSPKPSVPSYSPTTSSPVISSVNSPIRMTFAEAKKSLDSPTIIEKRSVNAKQSYENSSSDCRKESMPSINTDAQEFDQTIEAFKTPVAPPRLKHEEARRTAEKAKQEARERARLKSDEDLGLSPEDKIKLLRMKVARRQLSMEDGKRYDDEITPDLKIRHYSFTSHFQKPRNTLQPSKSTDNVKTFAKKMTLDLLPASSAKSMDELARGGKDLDVKTPVHIVLKRDKKKTKDPERRRSIIQAVSDFFKKKEATPSPTSHKDKSSVFRLASRSKEKTKLDKIDRKSEGRPKSVSEGMLIENFQIENSPPVPPPPMNYPETATNISDDSLSEDDSKTAALSPSQMQKDALVDGSCSSITRKAKNTKRLVRQAQLKRLRMAQEIQRKLEETEVKQRDLESRGVSVEKALRGEGDCSGREETDLLGEWFDLMRERTELRRYEKELLVRAQEVQLEDRHERLQQELRERLADDDGKKTRADVKKEGEILEEMLEIVAKRDSLIALLEDERQRYKIEDKDLEAQMLAKGLRLTPIEKDETKYSV